MSSSNITRKRFTTKELLMFAEAVAETIANVKRNLTKEEIEDLAQELNDTHVDRNYHSFVFALNRMYLIISGSVPDGENPRRAEQMFLIPEKMKVFASKYLAIDVNFQLNKAKQEFKLRSFPKKRKDAKEAVLAYYKLHKNELAKDIGKKRDQIIKFVEKGISVPEAFEKAMS